MRVFPEGRPGSPQQSTLPACAGHAILGMMRRISFLLSLLALSACAAQDYHLRDPAKFSGMSDASGGAAVSSNLFVAASDEDNVLRVYDSSKPGPPVQYLDCNAFLEVTGKNLEADLEAAATIGNRIFWTGSHGRNRDGKDRPNRCRLFATDFRMENGRVVLTLAGRPCKSLLPVLTSDQRLKQYHLGEAALRAPKEPGALNIEGLSATPEGHLLIGFRNPIPRGKALVVPLLNPNEVIEGKPPELDAPIELDLEGLGIRDFAWTGNDYLIIGGSFKGGHESKLFRWSGGHSQPEKLRIKHFDDYNPEAIILYPGSERIQILSDDGTREVDGVQQKLLPDPSQRTFRSFWLEPKHD
jgi:hypothetical protein